MLTLVVMKNRSVGMDEVIKIKDALVDIPEIDSDFNGGTVEFVDGMYNIYYKPALGSHRILECYFDQNGKIIAKYTNYLISNYNIYIDGLNVEGNKIVNRFSGIRNQEAYSKFSAQGISKNIDIFSIFFKNAIKLNELRDINQNESSLLTKYQKYTDHFEEDVLVHIRGAEIANYKVYEKDNLTKILYVEYDNKTSVYFYQNTNIILYQLKYRINENQVCSKIYISYCQSDGFLNSFSKMYSVYEITGPLVYSEYES